MVQCLHALQVEQCLLKSQTQWRQIYLSLHWDASLQDWAMSEVQHQKIAQIFVDPNEVKKAFNEMNHQQIQ